MQIIRDIAGWPKAAQGAVVALGNFDGVHAGHQALLATARSIADAMGKPCAVMTFEPHPRRFFQPERPPLRIVRFAQKARLLKEAGVEYLYVARFNKQLAETSAEDFVHKILHEGLHVSHVVTGYDFAFGHRRSGNADYLDEQARNLGFGFTRIAPVHMQGEGLRCSSSAIREALTDGNMKLAAAMLGRLFSICGRVVHGDKRGRTLGFPTANILLGRRHMPAFGVYAVELRLRGEPHWHPAVANLGNRPTVAGDGPLLEVHVLDDIGDIYNKEVEVRFHLHLRPEQKFDGLDSLKHQIARDVAQAKEVLDGKAAQDA